MLKEQDQIRQQLLLQRLDSKNRTSGVFYKFQSGLCYEFCYGECVRQLNIGSGKHISNVPPTKKHLKQKNSFVGDNLLFFNHLASYGDFSILRRENKNFLLELKESLLIVRDKPFLNRNITSASLYLFGRT